MRSRGLLGTLLCEWWRRVRPADVESDDSADVLSYAVPVEPAVVAAVYATVAAPERDADVAAVHAAVIAAKQSSRARANGTPYALSRGDAYGLTNLISEPCATVRSDRTPNTCA